MPEQTQSARRAEPTPARPHMPGYGISAEMPDPETYPWSAVVDQLARARNYWVSTARPDGGPHAMPVWGLWLDDAFCFSTSRGSRKGRNLAANPRLVVHLESGDVVVILEGVAEELADPALLTRFVDAYDAKYQIRPDPHDPANATYILRPQVAFTWQEAGFVESALRWHFSG